ncbi:MAG: AraC family transcriptional regulator [Planctomycetota bacterium]|nr:MAG: AraC family transcriptional regulator [Planctomycetota bacterium]
MMDTHSQQAFLTRVSGAQLIGLFHLMPDVSFFIKDRKGRFVALNRRGCEFCGVASEREALGKTDRDFFPRRRADEYIRDDRAVMSTGQPIINRVESAPESEGSARLVMTNKIPLRGKQGQVIGLAGFSRLTDQVRERPEAVERFAAVMQRIHSHPDEEFTSRDLARVAGLSVSQFDRTFRQCFGTSPRQYLLRVRIEAACQLLAQTGKTIAAIAAETGFHDHAHLTRTFQGVMNTTPSVYRREHQSPHPDRPRR